MGQEKNFEDLAISKSIKHITSAATATYTLTRMERTVIVDATNSSGAITIKLRPASEMFGKIVTVALTTLATSSVVVSVGYATTIATLDTSGDDCVLYSDGIEWRGIGGTFT